MAFVVTGLFTVFYINTLTPPEKTTDEPAPIEEEMIDLLFANRSHISAQGAEQFVLSQKNITYEISPVGDNSFEMIGDLNDAKKKDGSGFGFRIHWNGTITSERIFFAIVLRFPADIYPEKKFDFRVEFTVVMTHNVSFDYHFGACVSQQIFYPEPVVWPFEIFGTADGKGILELSTDYLDNESYMVIREGGIITPMLTLELPLKQGYITEVLLDYAAIEVWDKL
jgi:hypothetical protein